MNKKIGRRMSGQLRRTSATLAAGALLAAAPFAAAPAAVAAPQITLQAQEEASENQACEPALYPMVKDDRSAPPVWTEPSSLMFGISDAGKATSPVDIGPISADQDIWMIGSTQVSGIPWLGANTQHESFTEKTTGEVTMEISSFSGPGDLVVADGGSLGVAFGSEWFHTENGVGVGSHTIGANTHVHPNWLFTTAGEYQVGITQTAPLNAGNTIRGTATLNFNVGGAGDADDGHFDFGPTIGCVGESTEGAEGATSGA